MAPVGKRSKDLSSIVGEQLHAAIPVQAMPHPAAANTARPPQASTKRACSLCGLTGHLQKSHCQNYPDCEGLRNHNHNEDCEFRTQTEGCGKEGCTVPGHLAKSHCVNYPTCTGLRGSHDDSCPLKKATGIQLHLVAPDAQSLWWSMTFTVTGADVPSSWLKKIFEALDTDFKADKILVTQEVGSKKQLLHVHAMVKMKCSLTKSAKTAVRQHFEDLLKIGDDIATKFQCKPLAKNQGYKYVGG